MTPFWDPQSGLTGGILYSLICLALLSYILQPLAGIFK